MSGMTPEERDWRAYEWTGQTRDQLRAWVPFTRERWRELHFPNEHCGTHNTISGLFAEIDHQAAHQVFAARLAGLILVAALSGQEPRYRYRAEEPGGGYVRWDLVGEHIKAAILDDLADIPEGLVAEAKGGRG